MPRLQQYVSVFAIAFVGLSMSACGKSDPVAPVRVGTVAIDPPSASVVVGNTQQFAATVRDEKGAALTGRALAWTSSNIAVATVDGGGVATGVAPGTATITVSSEGKSAPAIIAVIPIPVASLEIAPLTLSPLAASTFQLVATARDARGNALANRTIIWTSGNTAIATISGSGLVTALAAGSVTFTALSEGQAASLVVTILPAPVATPAIQAVTPAIIVPGATLTIAGTGFDGALANNLVTVGGAAASVLSATPTQLTVAAPCVEGGAAPVRVTTRGVASNVLNVAVTVVRRTLGVGQSLVLTGYAESLCNELATTQANARYLVTVYSASTGVNTLSDVELAGSTPVTVATLPAVRYAPTSMQATGERTLAPAWPAALRAEAVRDEKFDDAHWAMLERNRVDYERGMQLSRAASASLHTLRTAASRIVELPKLGDMRSLFFTFTGGCNDTTRVVRGKAIYVGSRTIIWEDSTNTLQSSTTASLADYYDRIGRIFDQDQYDVVKNTFGDPLLRDSLTDGDERVHMVFTNRVNGTDAAAYVTSCDQFPTSTYKGSNLGQFFYGFVPTTAAPNINNTASPDGWFSFMGRTIVHEVKHIASLSARVANGSPVFEASWLEEGTARHAEEVWVRTNLHHVGWKANTGFGTAANNGIYCDFLPGDSPCLTIDPLRRPSYGMRRQFNEIRDKMVQPWNWSPYGDGTGQSGAVFYNTAWSLVRYAIDRYATSDAAFFKTLINSSTSGTVNLAATAGVPIEQLIGGWGLALYADDYPGLTSPSADMQFPTWNLRSIYGGLFDSPTWNTRFNTRYPLQPTQLDFGPFVSRVTGVRGGAHAYFEISGAARAVQLLNLRGLNGAAASPNLRMAIARLQ